MTTAHAVADRSKGMKLTAFDIEKAGGEWVREEGCYRFADGSCGAFSKVAAFKNLDQFSHYRFEPC